MKISYKSGKVPAEYKCGSCGAHGCKLWREYQTFYPRMACAICAATKLQDKQYNIADLDADGCRTGELGRKVDQIGWYVPAIPDEEGIGFWGYTSACPEGYEWWRKLPSQPVK